MSNENWKLKEGVEINIDDVAKIACALKSLSAYTTLACAEEDSPDDLDAIVEEGLDAMNNIFEI